MRCEWETWAEIKTAVAGQAPQPDVYMGILGAPVGTYETQPWNIPQAYSVQL